MASANAILWVSFGLVVEEMKIEVDVVQVVDVGMVEEKKCTCRDQQLSVKSRFWRGDKERPGRNAQTFGVAPETRHAIKFAWTWATDAKL